MELEIIKWIRPGERAYETAEQVNADSDRVLCFDLDEFPFDNAIHQVNRIRQFGEEAESVIVPCIMLLMALDSNLLPEQIDKAVNAGTILYERPPDSSNVSTLDILLAIEREIKDSESAIRVDSEKQSGDQLKYEADLELFANPIAEIDKESFERLVKRMQLPDSSWEKDD